ncbi:hypothetical protein IVB45_09640 [Bradyrhizobium sp. 4]|uniref:hypothetical protein n=1 Tax=unclassified Bradyrhizobium TaxID=2631580 RepID=UPI001FFB51E1|nr:MULTISPECIES: hypothetical protein [unclassified Bradyrhizobium]MCK1397089.1 hypothetical protein [Bradyrhizobium sp. 39]MCK1752873.1 hypothetical protein [Bradyrhizobium sp. 135]UPJ37070.1 hypothetical protein IVB45_09640 [Bradyrhizobium sp. 4]
MTTQLIQATDHLKTAWHSQDSSLREQALAHIFLGDLLAAMWRADQRDIEVLKGEVDRGGYDLVLESNGLIRHVQLKSSFISSKVRHVSIGTKLLAKPGGCVIWLVFDPASLKIERYLWLGGDPGQALPDIGSRVARHSKSNSLGQKMERPMHREVAKSKFQAIMDIDELKSRLFGG